MPSKPRPLATLVLIAMLCLFALPAAGANDFREQMDLKPFTPPEWFLAGHFVAREVQPRYLFGSVSDFVKSLHAKTSWLIEEEEAKRQERLAQEGKSLEYTVYLEVEGSLGPMYWLFVVLPHKSAQAWFEERFSYHKSKTKAYYGQTLSGLERAFAEGLTISGELRYLVEHGQTSLKVPEDVLTQVVMFPASYDLQEGKRLPAAH